MSECKWPTCGCQNVHGSPWCKASTVVQPPPALAALAMRERAAGEIDCGGCYGDCQMPHDCCSSVAASIRALPTTFNRAELLAAARQLPEVRALVEAADKVDDEYCGQEYGPTMHTIEPLRAALAPFVKGGE